MLISLDDLIEETSAEELQVAVEDSVEGALAVGLLILSVRGTAGG
jgi:hypothetical protein